MSNAWEWTEQDVLRLIADQEGESLTLDYKASDGLQKTDAKKKEMAKDVSAFANSAGGVLLYGVQEQNNIPVGIDGGYDPSDITREWIEQVISSRIQRRIDGVRINQITLSGAHAGRVIYAVCVPQSLRAPHMADDRRYYKRHEYCSIPMEEYEVRDVARRVNAPILRLQMHVSKNGSLQDRTDEQGDRFKVRPAAITVEVRNESPVIASYSHYRFWFEKDIEPHCDHWNRIGSIMIRKGRGQVPAHGFAFEMGLRTHMPIWQGNPITLCRFLAFVPVGAPERWSPVVWELLAPGSDTHRGGCIISCRDPGDLEILEVPRVETFDQGFVMLDE